MAGLEQQAQGPQLDILKQIHETLQSLQHDYQSLSTTVEAIQGQVNIMTAVKQVQAGAVEQDRVKREDKHVPPVEIGRPDESVTKNAQMPILSTESPALESDQDAVHPEKPSTVKISSRPSGPTARIVLTT